MRLGGQNTPSGCAESAGFLGGVLVVHRAVADLPPRRSMPDPGAGSRSRSHGDPPARREDGELGDEEAERSRRPDPPRKRAVDWDDRRRSRAPREADLHASSSGAGDPQHHDLIPASDPRGVRRYSEVQDLHPLTHAVGRASAGNVESPAAPPRVRRVDADLAISEEAVGIAAYLDGSSAHSQTDKTEDGRRLAGDEVLRSLATSQGASTAPASGSRAADSRARRSIRVTELS